MVLVRKIVHIVNPEIRPQSVVYGISASNIFLVLSVQEQECAVISLVYPLVSMFYLLQEPEREARPSRLPITQQGQLDSDVAAPIIHMKNAELSWSETEGMPGYRASPATPAQPSITSHGSGSDPSAQPKDDLDTNGSASSTKFKLDDVCLEVQPGHLVVVCGVVGSGKTSLIEAILGEMVLVKGDVQVRGTYICLPNQEPQA